MNELELLLPSKELEFAALEYKRDISIIKSMSCMEALFLTTQIHMMIG
ncbi:hypothetical protein [Pelosinus baikalensis]|uniref:Uncharacterized protein n=1 Tax=Pelosinus baikalensis TaxID=2892015 RepID=A0ABS8HS41_9FIRM|nr:hypothetical protein [Pelosinus baikalensis]MCC5465401.1 hypothetical protein [Pelosinus baikalensis]